MKLILSLALVAALSGCAHYQHQQELAAKPGAKLGMTTDQVLHETSWGEPITINRTVTAHGVHEQWVYGGTNYLYFTNGKLTSVQN
jgi:hypothetical protein